MCMNMGLKCETKGKTKLINLTANMFIWFLFLSFFVMFVWALIIFIRPSGEISRTPVGLITDVDSEAGNTVVKCEKRVVILSGSQSIPIWVPAVYIKMDKNPDYLIVEKKKYSVAY